MNLSDFLKSINSNKAPLLDEDVDGMLEKSYPGFIVNRCLSYFPDTILLANTVNCHPELIGKMAFDFLRLSATKRSRFSKWEKVESDPDVEIIKQHYKVNHHHAVEYKQLMSESEINRLRDLHNNKKWSKERVKA